MRSRERSHRQKGGRTRQLRAGWGRCWYAPHRAKRQFRERDRLAPSRELSSRQREGASHQREPSFRGHERTSREREQPFLEVDLSFRELRPPSRERGRQFRDVGWPFRDRGMAVRDLGRPFLWAEAAISRTWAAFTRIELSTTCTPTGPDLTATQDANEVARMLAGTCGVPKRRIRARRASPASPPAAELFVCMRGIGDGPSLLGHHQNYPKFGIKQD